MSALLLKDYYVIFRQMKIFLLLILVFSCIPGTFYSTFAVVYASMLPYTALAYDERSRWDQMAAMMPYSARDVVLSKYLFGWIAVAPRRRPPLSFRPSCRSSGSAMWRVPPSPSSCCPCAWPCASWTSPCP